MKLLPNDRYPLDREVFRLYYTSGCTDRQTIDIYFEDNAGQVVLLSFSFNNENEEEEMTEVTEKSKDLPTMQIDTTPVRFPPDSPDEPFGFWPFPLFPGCLPRLGFPHRMPGCSTRRWPVSRKRKAGTETICLM